MSHLTNPLATASQLHAYANFSSLPLDLQEAVFIATQCLTQAAGVLLEIPQSITAKANVILARYWLVDPPMANEFSVGTILLLRVALPSARLAKAAQGRFRRLPLLGE